MPGHLAKCENYERVANGQFDTVWRSLFSSATRFRDQLCLGKPSRGSHRRVYGSPLQEFIVACSGAFSYKIAQIVALGFAR